MKKDKSPFLKEKPSGTLPKKSLENSYELELIKKSNEALNKLKIMLKDKGIEHYRLKSKDGRYVIKGLYHIQNVNGLHSRLKRWIGCFKGVATKYLDNYLAWFLFVDNRSNESAKHNIKDFLLSSFVYETNDTYNSLRLSKFNV